MRLIGQLSDKEKAVTFSDYLFVKGIENMLEETREGAWSIWVYSEDDIDKAKRLLHKFRSNPDHPAYEGVSLKADKQKQVQQKAQNKVQSKIFTRERIWPGAYPRHKPYLTLTLITISIIVAILSSFGRNPSALQPLMISRYVSTGGAPWWHGLVEVANGQWWRLVTPIFIHFGIIHLLFNMLWLNDLGRMVEQIKGPLYFGVMTLIIAICSNLGQYALTGPNFGGMSGVVYGLLGYVWMKGKYDPASGMRLHPTIVVMMVIWFFLGLTGLIGHIANAAHGIGLCIGIVWGYISAKRRRVSS
jgi:GlpG protein